MVLKLGWTIFAYGLMVIILFSGA